MEEYEEIKISQTVAILIDGNNIEIGLQTLTKEANALLDFDNIIPKLLNQRGLSRLIYFREGKSISSKLADRLLNHYHGSVVPCHKSADIPLTINATQIAKKVDTIVIMSGDSDYVELVRHLKGEGVRVEIAALEHTTAQILIDEADHFTPITKEDCYIRRPSRGKKTPTKPTAKKGATTTKKPTAKKPVTQSKASPTNKTASVKKADSKTKQKQTEKKTTKSNTRTANKTKTNTTKKASPSTKKKQAPKTTKKTETKPKPRASGRPARKTKEKP